MSYLSRRPRVGRAAKSMSRHHRNDTVSVSQHFKINVLFINVLGTKTPDCFAAIFLWWIYFYSGTRIPDVTPDIIFVVGIEILIISLALFL